MRRLKGFIGLMSIVVSGCVMMGCGTPAVGNVGTPQSEVQDATATLDVTPQEATRQQEEENVQEGSEVQANRGEGDLPTVYMTTEISSESLMALYAQLGVVPEGNVAVKLSTGEAGNTHYLDPSLIAPLVEAVDGTIVECNTAYGGRRASTALQIGRAHV